MNTLDPLYLAFLNFRINKIDDCHQKCSQVLEKNPLDQAAWCLKLICFTEEVYIDELENDEAGLADTYMDDNVVATAARPGTSLNKPLNSTASGASSLAIRPRTNTGRPLSGMIRPESRLKTGGIEQALRTSRTSRSARPVSSSTARQARLGTASMIAQQDGSFVNLGRLNINKYANDKTVNRYLLGIIREAEKQFNASLLSCKMVETYTYLSKVYRRLDQPLSSIEHLKQGLKVFPNDPTLLTFLARIYEDVGETEKSIEKYKELLRQDASNIEGFACIGTNFFYNNQPEIALKYYRRILQMGVTSAELYSNIGLCCFYCQQFDFAIGCFEQAHAFADDSMQADLWYNTAIIAIANCDLQMAERCLKIALASDPDHAESLCNLGVIKMQESKMNEAQSLFQTAIFKGPHLYEPYFNFALLQHEIGNYAECFVLLKKSLELFPDHFYSKKLLLRVETILSS